MKPAPFVIDEHVRWSDVDAAGIIFYGSYIRFIELAETELFRAAGLPYGEVFDRYDILLPRVQVHTEFHYPARLDDRLRMAVYYAKVGRTSLTMNFEAIHLGADRLAAHGYLVLACTERTSLKPRALPPELVQLLKPFTLSVEAARAQLGLTGARS